MGAGNDMSQLKELTEQLPEFPPPAAYGGGLKVHKLPCGTSLSLGLKQQAEISCADWFHSASTVLPPHCHRQREWLIIYMGRIDVFILPQQMPPDLEALARLCEDDLSAALEEVSRIGERHALRAGNYLVIEPNVAHCVNALMDTWFLAVTIPMSVGWPRDPHAPTGIGEQPG